MSWQLGSSKYRLGEHICGGMDAARAIAGDRQLATDILYALDAVGVLVSEVYKLEASIGLIGPL